MSKLLLVSALAACGSSSSEVSGDLAQPLDAAAPDLAVADLAVADSSGPDLADPRVACAAAGGICRREFSGEWTDECDQLLNPRDGTSTYFWCSTLTPTSSEVCCHPRPCVQAGGSCEPIYSCSADSGERDGGGCESDWVCCL